MKVLIVDDEVILAKALMRAFTSRGHDVVLAHTGEDGVTQWKRFLPDVVFLDVVMPGLTGPQVIKEVKNSSDSYIILMTAHSGIKGREMATEIGADDFIQKPFGNVFDLVTKVENIKTERRRNV